MTARRARRIGPPRPTPCASRPSRRRRPVDAASRWWRSAATAAASWRRTPTSTSCWSTTRTVEPGRVRPRRSGTRCGTPASASTTRCARSTQMVAAAGRRPPGRPRAARRSATSPATRTSPCGCAPTMLAAVAPRGADRLPALRDLVRAAARAGGRAGPRSRCPTSRRPRAGCATPPCSRRWSRPGWSTCPTPTSSGAGQALLDVRDAAPGRRRPRHRPGRARAAGRALAAGLGLDGRRGPPRSHVRELGRRITHLSRLTWRRVDAVLARPALAPGRAAPA